MKRILSRAADKEFASHVCAKHPCRLKQTPDAT
jgi:hypothetical protein